MASERRSDISRLEGFSDAVFAFALTLLVVSLQVPSSYTASSSAGSVLGMDRWSS